MKRRQAVELPRLKLHQQRQMQNHEGELKQRRKGREDEVAGGDSGELPLPGRRPPCQLLLLLSHQLRYLSQNLRSLSQTRHLSSSLRQLQQLLQLQLLQQQGRAGPTLTNLTVVGLLLEGGRWVGRGPAPRIALLSAPSHHREGSRNCELCSPFQCIHYHTLLWIAFSPSQWSQLHRPLPGPQREESHLLLARPELSCHPLFCPKKFHLHCPLWHPPILCCLPLETLPSQDLVTRTLGVFVSSITGHKKDCQLED